MLPLSSKGIMVVRPAGNISGEATTRRGTIFNEEMRGRWLRRKSNRPSPIQ